jgi:hypothetical protein
MTVDRIVALSAATHFIRFIFIFSLGERRL